jgi:hypothetical protein
LKDLAPNSPHERQEEQLKELRRDIAGHMKLGEQAQIQSLERSIAKPDRERPSRQRPIRGRSRDDDFEPER